MQKHADEGARIIDRLGFLNDAVPAIRHHHERFDGAGYPDRLKGEEIPLAARIIAACDAFQAMTSNRPYQAAVPQHEALAELRRCAGAHFDPVVVGVLCEEVEDMHGSGPLRAAEDLGDPAMLDPTLDLDLAAAPPEHEELS